jgi:hypothetical protein
MSAQIQYEVAYQNQNNPHGHVASHGYNEPVKAEPYYGDKH